MMMSAPAVAPATNGSPAEETEDLTIAVVCNGFAGEFDPTRRVFYYPRRSQRSGPDEKVSVLTPTEFERYAGMASSKKWKYSVRVDLQAVPDIVWDVNTLGPYTLGKWLEENGFDKTRGRGSGSHHARSCASASASGQTSWLRMQNDATENAENEDRAVPSGPDARPKSRWLSLGSLAKPQHRGGSRAHHFGSSGFAAMATTSSHRGGPGHGDAMGPRIGSEFQIPVPPCLASHPRDDPDNLLHPEREGVVLFESEEQARASAVGVEKEGAKALPHGAICDSEGSDSDDESSILQREKSRRTRKRPKWLQGSVNMFTTEEELAKGLSPDSTKHSVRLKLHEHGALAAGATAEEETPRSRNRNVFFGGAKSKSGAALAERDGKRKRRKDYFRIAKVEVGEDNCLRVVVVGREGEKWSGALGPNTATAGAAARKKAKLERAGEAARDPNQEEDGAKASAEVRGGDPAMAADPLVKGEGAGAQGLDKCASETVLVGGKMKLIHRGSGGRFASPNGPKVGPEGSEGARTPRGSQGSDKAKTKGQGRAKGGLPASLPLVLQAHAQQVAGSQGYHQVPQLPFPPMQMIHPQMIGAPMPPGMPPFFNPMLVGAGGAPFPFPPMQMMNPALVPNGFRWPATGK